MKRLISGLPRSRSRALFRSFSTSRQCLADHVRIVEVGPRDGLQNEKSSISLETKLELIRRLAQTGVTHMEAGSFVPAKWVPQMASTAEILESILTHPPPAPHGIAYNYLVPNIRGLENLLKIFRAKSARNPSSYPTPPPSPRPEQAQGQSETTPSSQVEVQSANSTEISLFAAATETFSQKNTNCSIAESLERSKPILELAKQHNIRVRGYVSVALGCPYEGPDVNPHKVAEITATLLEMGCDEVSVADTTGMGTAPRTAKLLQTLKEAGILDEDLALHFHDTYGMALVNTVVGLEHGVRVFDSSVGGLGGCPYSKGATGNVATEDLLHLLHSLGCETGVDMVKMAEIGQWITAQLGRPNDSRAGKATLARLKES
ncbi:hydroxymethylglutaryl-CoA lyase [Cladophialophora psammophila CBS 110553]|uniref:hydroxymethylglutaryl-CoA lyase n=1 Tax=Cladophialophora psammophila CBS 110553 TaxID=1182543 RepID=W9WYF7_9EURO|nr:hydroxymethylglutaryl-CoA lyase [Cladophialophora psammophila CBS 110553]EXJ72973.1 hydroxymethylglutaryl-CoA lyase [Cladophialophora psammophila CBS 110553]